MRRDPIIAKPREWREVKGTHVVFVMVIGIVGIIAGIELMGFRDLVPPRSQTNEAMWRLKGLLLEDAQARGRVVASLAELPGYEADAFPFVDGWQECIGFAVEGDRVVLQSLGGDMKVGGLGADLDLVGIFNLHAADGSWADVDEQWLVDPVLPGSAAAAEEHPPEPATGASR